MKVVASRAYCAGCGLLFQSSRNVATNKVAAAQSSSGGFWKRFAQAVFLTLQQQAAANMMRQGDNFWSSSTASGNDNGQSGYVDVGGTIVGYDR